MGLNRDTTVVRIPLRSAKHHFGVSVTRGQRPYNEDSYQAGVIGLPAFAKRSPISITRAPATSPLQAYRERQRQSQEQSEAKKPADNVAESGVAAGGAGGDPQVFYFGVFDGHGGAECSGFLRESLHEYIETAAKDFCLGSSLRPANQDAFSPAQSKRVAQLEEDLIKSWRDLVGGYFRRFKPTLFSQSSSAAAATSIDTVMTYAFLRADYEFVHAQARKSDSDADLVVSDAPLNASDVLDSPSTQLGGPKRFQGGSTCSVALISTPSPTPFWHPSAHASLLVAHVGDTRIILCRTADGAACPVTSTHHPSNASEGQRLRRYAGNFVTDSFGEERMSGLANTRAFGDMASKRIGVSAEPEIRRLELRPAEFAFIVLVSDGVSATLSDQEIVDIVKEAKTPELGARDVVGFASEVSRDGDNATAIVVRMGGWERREEGGGGSMGTREQRVWRRE